MKVLFIAVCFFSFGFVASAGFSITKNNEHVYFLPDMFSDVLNIGSAILSWDQISLVSSTNIKLNSYEDITINAGKNTLISLPNGVNGEMNINGKLYYDSFTGTVKFQPINKTTCGGLE